MKEHPNLRVSFNAGPPTVPFFSKWSKEVSQWPGQCVTQFQTRPQSFHMSVASGKNPFSMGSRTYQKVQAQAKGDQATLLAMLNQPGMKEAILADMAQFKPAGQAMMFSEYKNDAGVRLMDWMFTGTAMYAWDETYEPPPEAQLSKLAEAQGRNPLDLCYDLLLDTEGPHAGVVWRPLFGYMGTNDPVLDCFDYDYVIPGFADAGAHCTILTDATVATSNIAYYGNSREKLGIGKVLPLERIVKSQTADVAGIFGLNDRGTLQPGMRADINVMDLDRLKIKAPYWANDLPTNAGRWLQYTEGYKATVMRG